MINASLTALRRALDAREISAVELASLAGLLASPTDSAPLAIPAEPTTLVESGAMATVGASRAAGAESSVRNMGTDAGAREPPPSSSSTSGRPPQRTFAMPKSRILTRLPPGASSSSITMMFSGFRSRWTTLEAWAAAMAVAIW